MAKVAKEKKSGKGQEPTVKPPAAAKRYRILSLDGGGIRGIIGARWLARLEAELGAGARLADHFDLVAGTSTGSILAAAATQRIPMAEMVRMYREEGKKIFPGTAERLWSRFTRTFTHGPSAPKYSDSGLADVLRSHFKNVTLKDVTSPVLLITTYNTLTREALVFKSYNVRTTYADIPLWEIVKSSCSAPTYFPAHVLTIDGRDAPLIDGGVVANNPTACAVAEGMRINDKDSNPDPCKIEDFAVVSVGTGQLMRPISIADAREWGAVEWAVPIIDVLFDGAADATDYIVGHMVPTGRYVRMQTQLDKAYDDMDNAGETNLNALLNVADDYIESKDGQMALAGIVKLIR